MVRSSPHCKRRFTFFLKISLKFWSVILRGMRSIWWGWRVTSVAPRIANDDLPVFGKFLWNFVFFVAGAVIGEVGGWHHFCEILECHFAWHAQYLVRLEGKISLKFRNVIFRGRRSNYYLLKIIQKFWLVKSGGWNRHIRSVVAQIWSYDIIIEYWKHIRHYDVICSYIENTYSTLWRHTNLCCLCQMQNTYGLCCLCQNSKYK